MAKKKTTKSETKKSSCGSGSGLYIPASIFLGLGIGMLFDNAGAGIIVGLGIGFLTLAICKNRQ